MPAAAAVDADKTRSSRRPSMRSERRRALRWSYAFLVLFVIFFLTPPVYMLITSLKTSAEISAATNPWWVFQPTLRNYVELLTSPTYLTFFRNSALVAVLVVLYPHMTVYENMSFGLRLKKIPQDEIRRRVENAARILDIGELLRRKPKQLSGGQRQRVAMGRAIVRDPKVFLFDEPLSNLDAKLRVQMRTEIRKVHQKVRTTTVYVTHDQVEAMTLADRVVVMNAGRIEQVGAPNELYHAPATKFVAEFIGSPAMNIVPCVLEESTQGLRVRLSDDIVFPVPDARAARYKTYANRGQLLFGLRPEHFTERLPNMESHEHGFEATVDLAEPMGPDTLVYLSVAGTQICARVGAQSGARAGARLPLMADTNNMHLIDDITGKVL
jgi:multiple sugar transport system ATP-binding protein